MGLRDCVRDIPAKISYTSSANNNKHKARAMYRQCSSSPIHHLVSFLQLVHKEILLLSLF